MLTELVPLFSRLEAAAIYGPGKNELVRIFNSYQSAHPENRIYTLTDNYGRVWIRAKDLDRVCALLGLPQQKDEEAKEGTSASFSLSDTVPAMATRTVLIDDLDSSITEGVEPVKFSLGNRSYVIDLGADNRAKLEEALAPFIKAAASGNAPTKRAAVPAKEIREWAKQQPEKIRSLVKSDRGAVPKAVIAAYNEANGTKY